MNNVFVVLVCAVVIFSGCVAPEQNFSESDPNYSLANPALNKDIESLVNNNEQHRVIISVIDGGVDYNHKRLQNNLRLIENLGKQGVGFDLVGDDLLPSFQVIEPESGADVSSTELFDISQHGTHVSALATLGGILTTSDGEKISAGQMIGLLPIRVLPSTSNQKFEMFAFLSQELTLGEQFFVRLEKGLDYAATNGAHIVNMSLGCDLRQLKNSENQTYFKNYFQTIFLNKAANEWSQLLLIAAAGNEKQELSDYLTVIPATLGIPNLITVGSLDDKNTMSDFTNYGKLVDVYVQGRDINSAVPCVEGICSVNMSGTSMASPLVANLAAKIKLIDQSLTNIEIKKIILDNADLKELVNPMSGQTEQIKVVNFKKSLASAKLFHH